jgi:hypothetical protein
MNVTRRLGSRVRLVQHRGGASQDFERVREREGIDGIRRRGSNVWKHVDTDIPIQERSIEGKDKTIDLWMMDDIEAGG